MFLRAACSRIQVASRGTCPQYSSGVGVETRAALKYAAVWVVALAAWQAGRPELIRSPRLVPAHARDGPEV
jgi:hypothetical protein